jgi:hypothetical protein
MYPTLASIRPLLANACRYMCSTPQKQPAATVAFWDPSGAVMAAMGAVENGRVSREKREVIRRTKIVVRKTDCEGAMVNAGSSWRI